MGATKPDGEGINNTPVPNDKELESPNTKLSTFGIRHLQCLLIFIALSVAYALRVNLSVAIVAMTDKNSTNPNFNEYNWSEKTKSILLSSFFWGYVVTQVPSGSLARKFGGKVTLLWGLGLCSVLAILTPVCADIGDWKLVVALRVLQGLCQGVVFPSTHTLVSKWAPAEERVSLGTYCYAGSQFGTVVMLAVSGLLASSSMGWPSIYYLSGGVGVVWAVIFFIWGASSPSEYKSISVAERNLIEKSSEKVEADNEKTPLKTPWLKFLTSPAFFVVIVVHSTNNWGFWTLLTEIPSYMKNVLGKDIKSNALLSALPYFAMFVLSFFFAIISSILNKKHCMPSSISRKLFNTIGHWIPAVTLICLGYVNADETSLAISLLVITVGINSATYLGFQLNHIDLSPNFAGILMGITNCAANIMSLLAPLVVGLIVKDEHDPEQWRIVFFIAAGLYFLGNLLFITFGKTDVQPWNDPEQAALQQAEKRKSIQIELQH